MTQSTNDFQAIKNSRTITWTDPTQVEDCKSMSGLDYWQAIQAGSISPSPADKLIGINVVEVDKGRIVLALRPEEYHYGSFGTVQNGIISTLLEAAIGYAVHTTLSAGYKYTVLDTNIRYMRPIMHKTGIVYCEGNVIQASGHVVNAGAKLFDETKKLYAHATSKYTINRFAK